MDNQAEWTDYQWAYYNIYHPEYVLECKEDAEGNKHLHPEFYAYAETNEHCSYSTLDIKCFGTVMDSYQMVTLDGGRYTTPTPEWGFLGRQPGGPCEFDYKYFVKGSELYQVHKFFYHSENGDERIARDCLLDVILIYDSEKEKEDFELYVKANLQKLRDMVNESDQYSYVHGSTDIETQAFQKELRAGIALNKLFLCVDQLLVTWLNERLLNEDTGAKLDGHSIPEICEIRRKKHFSAKTGTSYTLLEAAWHIICAASYQPEKEFTAIQKKYIKEDYQIDSWYRTFIWNLDRLDNAAAYGQLRELVENIYTNEYLGKLLPAWNAVLLRGR